MATIGDIFPELSATFTEANLKKGAVFKMPLSERDGITPKNNEKNRLKYFIIVGFTTGGDVVGIVIINTNINKRIYTEELHREHYPLQKDKYKGVFTRNCFANCTAIKQIARQRILNEAKYMGNINGADFPLIYDMIINSSQISPKNKRKFGIFGRT
jgi:hypothetical protein